MNIRPAQFDFDLPNTFVGEAWPIFIDEVASSTNVWRVRDDCYRPLYLSLKMF
jgi:hypothetical protein